MNNFRFYLPDTSKNLRSQHAYMHSGLDGPKQQQHQSTKRIEHTNWHYDGLLHNTSSNGSSSTSTRSTTVHLTGGQARLQGQQQVNSSVEDTYQSVVNEHIYHTLEPQNEHSAVVDGTVYDSLCKLDVMLPNGQMVPATLVRNAQGRVIPLVEVNSRTLPHQQQGGGGGSCGGGSSSNSPVAAVTATPVSYNKILMQNTPQPPPPLAPNISNHRSASNQRHFV